MHRLKSIKIYFFSIFKLFFLSFRNIYLKTNFYNKKLITFIPERIFYNPSTYLSASLTSSFADFYKITNTEPKLLWKVNAKEKQKFENLHGLSQVPGIAVQRLMADGYGFAAEGDWKTAALVRAMKVMSEGMDGGNSFMEDYTYHFQSNGSQVLGAHMLEVCPTITNEKLRCEVHPLSIGGKQDPVRLVFNGTQGKGLNASIIDLGNRFRLIVNTLEAIIPKKLPKLPVARALWRPDPDLKLAAEAWILAGGAHHICYSQSVTPNHLKDFAEMLDIEFLLIDSNAKIEEIKNELKWNSIYYANRN